MGHVFFPDQHSPRRVLVLDDQEARRAEHLLDLVAHGGITRHPLVRRRPRHCHKCTSGRIGHLEAIHPGRPEAIRQLACSPVVLKTEVESDSIEPVLLRRRRARKPLNVSVEWFHPPAPRVTRAGNVNQEGGFEIACGGMAEPRRREVRGSHDEHIWTTLPPQTIDLRMDTSRRTLAGRLGPSPVDDLGRQFRPPRDRANGGVRVVRHRGRSVRLRREEYARLTELQCLDELLERTRTPVVKKR